MRRKIFFLAIFILLAVAWRPPARAVGRGAIKGQIGGGLTWVGHTVKRGALTLQNNASKFVGLLEKVGVIPDWKVRYEERSVAQRRLPDGTFADVLLRGSQPDDFKKLEGRGIRWVLSLRAEGPSDRERAGKGTNLRFYRIPILDDTAPTIAQALKFLSFVQSREQEHEPVLVHCHEGKSRTGTMIAIYRVAVDEWPVERALAEAQQLGYLLPAQKDFVRRFAKDLESGKISRADFAPRRVRLL